MISSRGSVGPRTGLDTRRSLRFSRAGVGAFLVLAGLQFGGAWLLLDAGVSARLVATSKTSFQQLSSSSRVVTSSDSAFISAMLPDTTVNVSAILRWTLNQATAVGDPGPVRGARAIYHLASEGQGLVCSQMAVLFQAALRSRGHMAREVRLARSLLSEQDTHVTVEVLVDGRWVIYDPTFHVTFQQDGRLLGSAEIHQAILEGQDSDIRPVFHGPVAYPARLDSYYMDWRPLFNNVLLFSKGEDDTLSRIPPFRYWLGPRWHYLALRSEPPLWQAAVGSRIYFFVVVVLPMSLAGAALVALTPILPRDLRAP